MKITNTKFYFFEKMCLEQFGNELGEKIIETSNNLYEILVNNADDRGSKAIRKVHIEDNMMPTIAYYKTLIQNGYDKKEAYDYTLRMTQLASREKAEKNKKIGNMKSGFTFFKPAYQEEVKNIYPEVGWKKEWIEFNDEEISVNFNSCIYHEIAKEQGCEEMCTIFCQNDDTAFEGYAPSIIFKREGTIAQGNEFCDFHFYRQE